MVARELERQLSRSGDAASLEDVQLIRQQVARCRDILTQMASDAGASRGESMVMLVPAVLVEEALEGLPGREQVRVEVDARAREEGELVPAHAFARAIRGVVKNALQASASGGEVRLSLVREGAGWRLTVEDTGAGMEAEVLARAGEPFFTTKAPGEGMGHGAVPHARGVGPDGRDAGAALHAGGGHGGGADVARGGAATIRHVVSGGCPGAVNAMTSPSPATAPPSLLLVDDEAVFRERLARAFRERGFEVGTAGSYDEALALASRESPRWRWWICACLDAAVWSWCARCTHWMPPRASSSSRVMAASPRRWRR